MMFVFAALGDQGGSGEKVWPVQLMYLSEATLLGVASGCLLITLILKRLRVSS